MHIHLGILIDALLQRFLIPDKKKASLCALIRGVLSEHERRSSISQLSLRRLTGVASSLTVAFRQINLWMRNLHPSLRPLDPPHARTQLTPSGLSDLAELLSLIPDHPGTLFADFAPDASLFVDAGEAGYGGHLSDVSDSSVDCDFFRPLPSAVVGTSSTKRELFGASEVLTLVAPDLRNKSLELKMDSACSVHLLLKAGSSSSGTNADVRNIFAVCRRFNIRLLPSWVPRNLNFRADVLSKHWAKIHTETLNPLALQLLRLTFPDSHIEFKRFGTLPKFFRVRFASTRSLPRLVLIHPVWPAQPWWPALCTHRKKFINLGDISVLFPTLSPFLAVLKNKPDWTFQASLL